MSGSGFNEEFAQLLRPFSVAPVADPDHVDVLGMFQGKEASCIGRFVKSPYPANSESFGIDTPQGFPKGQNAVELSQLHFEHLTGLCIGAMMAVIEQGDESQFLAQPKNAIDYDCIISFMQEDDVGLAKCPLQKFLKIFRAIVESYIHLRKRTAKKHDGLKSSVAFLVHQIAQ